MTLIRYELYWIIETVTQSPCAGIRDGFCLNSYESGYGLVRHDIRLMVHEERSCAVQVLFR